jgi:D-amino-acid dehydrogenase
VKSSPPRCVGRPARPLARSGRPTIGPVPQLDGLYVGTGMGAGGLTIGPHAGRLLADDVLRG